METIVSYLFWTSLYLAITAVVYALFVRKAGTPGQNRGFVITGLSASLLFAGAGQFAGGLFAAGGSPGGAMLLPEVVINASSGAYSGLENVRHGLYDVVAARRILVYIIASVSILFFLRMFVSLIYLATRIGISDRVTVDGCSYTNPFNYSSLKKRVMMMNKTFEGSRKRAVISMLIAIPLFGAALFIHSCNDEASKEARDAELEAAAQEAAYANDVIFTIADHPPDFPGGEQARQLFLEENLRYPDSAREEGVEGTVFVSFVVRHNGAITDAEILRGLHPDIDAEVLRVVNKMPRWEPGTQRGEDVSVQFNMPVRFRL